MLTVAVSDNNARPLVARLRILEEGNVNLRSAAPGAWVGAMRGWEEGREG